MEQFILPAYERCAVPGFAAFRLLAHVAKREPQPFRSVEYEPFWYAAAMGRPKTFLILRFMVYYTVKKGDTMIRKTVSPAAKGNNMDKLNVGVVGCGAISDIYIENGIKFQGYDIAACADILPERAAAKAAQYGIKKAYSFDEMIADSDIDIILNLTVHEAHAPLSMAALGAGKHIFNEKPLAASFPEGVEIMRLAKQKGLYVGCAPDTILGGRTQTFRKLIDDGRIGFPVGGVAYMACHGHECWHANPFFIYQPGGGPIYDMGPYYLTTLAYLLGPVKRLAGMVSTPFAERAVTAPHLYGQKIRVEVPTNINAMLEFENGAIVNAIFSYDVWDSHLPRMEIFGSEGTASVCEADPLAGPDVFGGEIEYRRMEDSDWMGPPTTIPRKQPTAWEVIQPSFPYTENTRGVGVADMAYAIQNGTPNRASGDMALHVLEIAHGVHVSAENGGFYDMATTFEQPAALPQGHVAFSGVF